MVGLTGARGDYLDAVPESRDLTRQPLTLIYNEAAGSADLHCAGGERRGT
jgi:hypothetical protein